MRQSHSQGNLRQSHSAAICGKITPRQFAAKSLRDNLLPSHSAAICGKVTPLQFAAKSIRGNLRRSHSAAICGEGGRFGFLLLLLSLAVSDDVAKDVVKDDVAEVKDDVKADIDDVMAESDLVTALTESIFAAVQLYEVPVSSSLPVASDSVSGCSPGVRAAIASPGFPPSPPLPSETFTSHPVSLLEVPKPTSRMQVDGGESTPPTEVDTTLKHM